MFFFRKDKWRDSLFDSERPGRRYLGGNERRRYQLSYAGYQLVQYVLLYTRGKTSAPGKVINSFCENTDGTIWIGTDNKGLWNYNPHDQSFTPVYLDAKNPDLSVHALYCDHHELWVGTYAHGVYRLNSATGKVTNYSDKNIKGLNPGSVYAIYKDSSGRLWFGTQTGILYYDIFSNSFVTIADLGYNSYITDITEDANHTICLLRKAKDWSAMTWKPVPSNFIPTIRPVYHNLSCACAAIRAS